MKKIFQNNSIKIIIFIFLVFIAFNKFEINVNASSYDLNNIAGTINYPLEEYYVGDTVILQCTNMYYEDYTMRGKSVSAIELYTHSGDSSCIQWDKTGVVGSSATFTGKVMKVGSYVVGLKFDGYNYNQYKNDVDNVACYYFYRTIRIKDIPSLSSDAADKTVNVGDTVIFTCEEVSYRYSSKKTYEDDTVSHYSVEKVEGDGDVSWTTSEVKISSGYYKMQFTGNVIKSGTYTGRIKCYGQDDFCRLTFSKDTDIDFDYTIRRFSNNFTLSVPKKPTIGTPTLSGSRFYGENISLSATGTNINAAAYRIFYTTSEIAPLLNPNSDYTSLGEGWISSDKAGTDVIINDSTSISKVIAGPTDTTWKHIVVKVGVESSSNLWAYNCSLPYKLRIRPVIWSVAVEGTRFRGESVIITGTGANIDTAAYRIFYTTSATAPLINPNADYSSPGSNWIQPVPERTGSLNIINSNSMRTIVGGTQLNEKDWTYVTFKVGVSSPTGDWVSTYTGPYSLTDKPNGDTYIGNVAHNQVIDLKDGTYAEVIDPYTPINSSVDLVKLNNNNTFFDRDIVKYRFGFDVYYADKIKDLKVIFDLNSLNDKGIDISLKAGQNKLYKLNDDGSFKFIKTLTSQSYKLGRQMKNQALVTTDSFSTSNKYYTLLGDNIISSNGNGRYIIEYDCVLIISPDSINTSQIFENELQIKIYGTTGSCIGTIESELPTNKTYIDTKINKNYIKCS